MADLRRLILPIATTLAVSLRFKLVESLCRLPACFFDGLALPVDPFSLPVGLSLLRNEVFLFFGIWNFDKDRPFLLGVNSFSFNAFDLVL